MAFCSECGAKLELKNKFCQNCGTNIKESIKKMNSQKGDSANRLSKKIDVPTIYLWLSVVLLLMAFFDYIFAETIINNDGTIQIFGGITNFFAIPIITIPLISIIYLIYNLVKKNFGYKLYLSIIGILYLSTFRMLYLYQYGLLMHALLISIIPLLMLFFSLKVLHE